MKKSLYILTHAFPYAPPTEEFLNLEITILSKVFDNIVIIPTSHSSYNRNVRNISIHNVLVERIIRKNRLYEILFSIIPAIFLNPQFYIEVVAIIKKKLLINVYAWADLFIGYISTYIISKKANSIIYKNNSHEDNIVIYSYWLSHLAISAAHIKKNLIKKGYQNVKTISRAHGSSDIFLSNKMKGYKAGKEYIKKYIDGIYSISEAGKRYLTEMGFQPNLIKIARLGVKDNGIRKYSKKDKFKIVSCSSINSIKRVHLIVEALSYIDDLDINWCHFGFGPLYDDLEKLCNTKLPKNIQFELKGNVNNSDILNYYKDSSPDLFVNVSSIEGIPVSIMEAISFGIPVIATDVGGTREICIDKFNGILLKKYFDLKDLSIYIKCFIKMDEIEYELYSHNARKLFEDKYNYEQNFFDFGLDIAGY